MTAIVKVENVSKKFARSLKKAMVYGLADIARAALIPHRYRSVDFEARLSDGARQRLDAAHDQALVAPAENMALRDTEFWAVQHVSFELRRGECLGLIGHNGAGKSTIFKMLSGIYGPTQGRISMQGRLSALLEVGAGFHPMLTGRENIYISGSIRGMTNEEIEHKYDKIVAFSGISEFIDMPIKFYSSGMLVRLGFAVLAHLEPDILLIDEILAVGDMEFQKQCIDHVNKLRESDMALALVSHSLYRIESLCHRSIWLDRGKIMMEGETREVVKAYREDQLRKSRAKLSVGAKAGDALAESPFFIIHAIELLDQQEEVVEEIAFGAPIRIRVRYTAKQKIIKPLFNFVLSAQEQRVIEASMLIDGNAPAYVAGHGEITCIIPEPTLLPNTYSINLNIRTQEGATNLMEPIHGGDFTILIQGLDSLGMRGPYAIGHLTHGNLVYHPFVWDLDRACLPANTN